MPMLTDDQRTLLIQITQDLVQLPSEAGHENEVAAYLLDRLSELEFQVVRKDPFGSVIAEIQGTGPGPTLLLDAHTDTVGVPSGSNWTFDPYGAQIIGGRLYGRGSSDMKGALAAMIVALATLNATDFPGRVVLSASVLEEVLEGAALEKVMEVVKPDFVLIGEASDLRIIRGGRGRAELSLEIVGQPSHSSAPHLGVNAVDGMLNAVLALKNTRLPSHPFVGQAIMVLTDIVSEPFPGHSVLPTRCRATFDRRLIPGEEPEAVLADLLDLPTVEGAQLHAAINQGHYKAFTGKSLESLKWYPAWVMDPDHSLVRRAEAGLSQAGLPVSHGAYNFCTNAAYSIGKARIPTIGFGPSVEGMAHISDEYIELDTLEKACVAYGSIVRSILGARPEPAK